MATGSSTCQTLTPNCAHTSSMPSRQWLITSWPRTSGTMKERQDSELLGLDYSLFPPHLFPHLCRVDVYDQLQLQTQCCVSSSDSRLAFKSMLTLSIHLCIRSSFPSPSLHIHPRHSFSTHILRPVALHVNMVYHITLISCCFLDISPTFGVPLFRSLLILSIFLSQHTSMISALPLDAYTFPLTLNIRSLATEAKITRFTLD